MKESIRMNLGDGGGNTLGLMMGGAGVFLVFSFILLYVNGVLRRFRKIISTGHQVRRRRGISKRGEEVEIVRKQAGFN